MALSVIKTNSIAAGNITSALISSVSNTAISGTIVGTQLGAGIVGQVSFFALDSAPTGWIKANGAAVSRTTYASLFATIGTTFGTGDGSTTFNVPDLRGYFPRGWDDSRGVDSGRSFGSTQTDALQTHTHNVNLSPGLNANQFDSFRIAENYYGSSWRPSTTDPLNARTASETRPLNIALLACIKF